MVSSQVVDPGDRWTPSARPGRAALLIAVVPIAFVACVVSLQTLHRQAIFGMYRTTPIPASSTSLLRLTGAGADGARECCSAQPAGLALDSNATRRSAR